MKTSQHARKRVRKRVGIKKKAVDRMRDSAFTKGLTHDKASGQLSKYFDRLFLEHQTANNVRMYANYVWIFAGETLITVFPIPTKLRKAVINNLKREERHENNNK